LNLLFCDFFQICERCQISLHLFAGALEVSDPAARES
jgi:hypothetical protein